MLTCSDDVFIIELTKDRTTEGLLEVLHQLNILSDDQMGKGKQEFPPSPSQTTVSVHQYFL